MSTPPSEATSDAKPVRTAASIAADEIETELNRPDRAKRSSLQVIALLMISLAGFAATGLINASWMSVAILVVVLFIHESGHWLGMKAFGYRDLQMFFIPFFGAAVTGKETNVTAGRKAVVALLGPAPGIILGIVSGFIYLKWKQPVFLKFGITSVFVNGLNLLPIYPLDGGRFMEAILFSRHPVAEVVFKVFAVFALAGLAFWLSSFSLGFLAFAAFLAAREAHYQGKIVRRSREMTQGQPVASAETIPRNYLESILPELSIGFPKNGVKPKILANRADAVWRKLCQSPPRFWPSFGFLALYAGIFLFGIVGAFGLVIADNASKERIVIVTQMGSDGRAVKVAEKYWIQHKIFEAQLNAQGLYDGPSTTWMRKGVLRKTGSWVNGFRQGEWKNYDAGGNLESVVTFEKGRPTKYQMIQDGSLVEVQPDQWPAAIKNDLQKSPGGVSLKAPSN